MTSSEEQMLVDTARRLLPKYGGVALFALNQACLLHAVAASPADLAALERRVLASRCDGQARYADDSPSVTRCAGWEDHDGDHVVGCSECWQRFHPQNDDGLAVNAANPLCPITNLPCVREDEALMFGRSCVVRRRGEAWVVATAVAADRGPGGPWWLLEYPDGDLMFVKPTHVMFPRRRLETT